MNKMINSQIIVIFVFALSMGHCLESSENPGQISQELEKLEQFELYSNKAMEYHWQEQHLDAVLICREMLSNVYGIYDGKDDSYFEDLTNSSYREIVEYVEYLIAFLNVNKSRNILLMGYEGDNELIGKDQYRTTFAGLINLLHIIQASCTEKHGDYTKALATYLKSKDYLSYWLERAAPSSGLQIVDGELREVDIPGAFDSPEVLQQLQESEKWLDEQIVRVANKLGVEPKLYLGEEEDEWIFFPDDPDYDDEQIPTITIDWPQAEETRNDNN